MSQSKSFGILRKVLQTLGLSAKAIEEIIQIIEDFLGGGESASAAAEDYPYHLRDDFLSPAERSFFLVLRQALGDKVLICPKVSLGDLFFAQTGDRNLNQSYRNRISRKHVDFLLCDPRTAKPLMGLELDDKSHQRPTGRNATALWGMSLRLQNSLWGGCQFNGTTIPRVFDKPS